MIFWLLLKCSKFNKRYTRSFICFSCCSWLHPLISPAVDSFQCKRMVDYHPIIPHVAFV